MEDFLIQKTLHGEDDEKFIEMYTKIEQALKLQELVKNRLDQLTPISTLSDDYDDFLLLRSLIDESEDLIEESEKIDDHVLDLAKGKKKRLNLQWDLKDKSIGDDDLI